MKIPTASPIPQFQKSTGRHNSTASTQIIVIALPDNSYHCKNIIITGYKAFTFHTYVIFYKYIIQTNKKCYFETAIIAFFFIEYHRIAPLAIIALPPGSS